MIPLVAAFALIALQAPTKDVDAASSKHTNLIIVTEQSLERWSIKDSTLKRESSHKLLAPIPRSIETAKLSPDGTRILTTFSNSSKPLLVIDIESAAVLQSVKPKPRGYMPWASWSSDSAIRYIEAVVKPDSSAIDYETIELFLEDGRTRSYGDMVPNAVRIQRERAVVASKMFRKARLPSPPAEESMGGHQPHYFGLYDSGPWGGISEDGMLVAGMIGLKSGKRRVAVFKSKELLDTIEIDKDDYSEDIFFVGDLLVLRFGKSLTMKIYRVDDKVQLIGTILGLTICRS